eukprot:7965020-Pyramimonas_sp.AAC.1
MWQTVGALRARCALHRALRARGAEGRLCEAVQRASRASGLITLSKDKVARFARCGSSCKTV